MQRRETPAASRIFVFAGGLQPQLSHAFVKMRVKIVPVLSDNYAYLLVAKDGTTAAVDPVEPSKIISAAESEGLKVNCVLTTHHHW